MPPKKPPKSDAPNPNDNDWLLPLTVEDLRQIQTAMEGDDKALFEQIKDPRNTLPSDVVSVTTIPYVTSALESLIRGQTYTEAVHKTVWIMLCVAFRAGQLAQIRSMSSAMLGEDNKKT